MIQHKIITEFESIAQSRSFSLAILAITSGLTVLLTLLISQLFEIAWYGALIPAYAVQCAMIIWVLNIYLRQNRFDEFAQEPAATVIGKILREERLNQSRSELSSYYGRDHRVDILLKILSILLDGSDFIFLTILKYLLLICIGIILLPYSFIVDAPGRYLSVLSESQADRKTGYAGFLFSSLSLGFFLFGFSVATWLGAWWLYSEGYFD